VYERAVVMSEEARDRLAVMFGRLFLVRVNILKFGCESVKEAPVT